MVGGILGGPGSVAGGVVGELILQPILAETIVYGAILMALILVMPRGIAGLVASVRVRRVRASRAARDRRAAASVTRVSGG